MNDVLRDVRIAKALSFRALSEKRHIFLSRWLARKYVKA